MKSIGGQVEEVKSVCPIVCQIFDATAQSRRQLCRKIFNQEGKKVKVVASSFPSLAKSLAIDFTIFKT